MPSLHYLRHLIAFAFASVSQISEWLTHHRLPASLEGTILTSALSKHPHKKSWTVQDWLPITEVELLTLAGTLKPLEYKRLKRALDEFDHAPPPPLEIKPVSAPQVASFATTRTHRIEFADEKTQLRPDGSVVIDDEDAVGLCGAVVLHDREAAMTLTELQVQEGFANAALSTVNALLCRAVLGVKSSSAGNVTSTAADRLDIAKSAHIGRLRRLRSLLKEKSGRALSPRSQALAMDESGAMEVDGPPRLIPLFPAARRVGFCVPKLGTIPLEVPPESRSEALASEALADFNERGDLAKAKAGKQSSRLFNLSTSPKRLNDLVTG